MDFIRQISNQRAIEALRNGVPNYDAVKVLGCNQPEIEEAFKIQLEKAEEATQSGQGKNAGIIIAGDFGSGKSHLLEYLTQVAFKRNFVCSKIVVSKETPLFDPSRLYRAAAESAVISGKRGNAMTEIITSLANRLGTQDYDSFYQWAHNDAGLNAVFGAILHLYRRLSNDPEVRNRIIQFLNGDKINIAEIRRLLRICGDQASYRFDKTSTLDFSIQKYKFVSRLIGTAGYSGWVLFFDEIELIARYSLRQRAKSYAEIARWLGKLNESNMAGITSVLAITEDYAQAVLNEKDDLEKAPGKLRASGNYLDQQLAVPAEKGIRSLNHDLLMLKRPSWEEVSETFQKVREVYTGAYGWEPDQGPDEDRLTSTRMRQHIRGWITEWDLKRLDKDYQPDIETERLILHYDEDADLEIAADEDHADY